MHSIVRISGHDGLDVKTPRLLMKGEMARISENFEYRRRGAARVRAGYARLLAGGASNVLSNTVTDNFDSLASGDPLEDEVNWTGVGLTNDNLIQGDGSGRIKMASSLAFERGAVEYTGASLSADQSVAVTYSAFPTYVMGITARSNATGCYFLRPTTSFLVLYRVVWPGTFTILAWRDVGLAGGETIRLDVRASTLTVFVDGVSQFGATDTVYADGNTGLYFVTISAADAGRMDDFSAADVALGSTSISVTEQPTRIYAFDRDDNVEKLIVAGRTSIDAFDIGGTEWGS